MKAKQSKAAVRKSSDNPELKRPAFNGPMPEQILEEINSDFNNIKRKLENYAAHLRTLDRRRLNGIGIKTQGFIERAVEYASESPEFLPPYLPLEKFRKDFAYYRFSRSLFDSSDQIRELLWNITIKSGDVAYTDSLEYYAMVREAAKRRIDPAESIHKDLEIFFKKRRKASGEPTEKELKRDMNALLHGKRDGKIVLENVKPKVIAGRRKIVDEKFDGVTQYKETNEASE